MSSDTPPPEPDQAGQGQALGPMRYSTLVLDAQSSSPGAQFLERWHTLFSLYSIHHLRSPLFFHLDPADRDSLLSFACNTARYEGECVEIGGVVGREVSKHARKQKTKQKSRRADDTTTSHRRRQKTIINERDRQDYRTPSTDLFADHCKAIVQRYGLNEDMLIRSGTKVVDIDYDYADILLAEEICDTAGLKVGDCIFRVKTASTDDPTTESVVFARAVVCATGPNIFSPAPPGADPASPTYRPRFDPAAATHTSQMTQFPAPQIARKLVRNEQTIVAVVGAGLTAVQLTSTLLAAGVSQVYLLVRSPQGLRVKPFDVDLSWMSKFKNARKAEFWGADGGDEERAAMIKEARGGGSITAPWAKKLKTWEAEGRVRTFTGVTVKDICELESRTGWSKSCDVKTQPQVDLKGGLLVDHVYFATGPAGSRDMYEVKQRRGQHEQSDEAQARASGLPLFLQSLQVKHPISWINGLPALTDDLSWYRHDTTSAEGKHSIPLFMTGALAALRLGPGAANLEGARIGAERVAWAIEDLPLFGTHATPLRRGVGEDAIQLELDGAHAEIEDYRQGVGGRYTVLADL